MLCCAVWYRCAVRDVCRWPRDDTTVFVVTTHHAEALVRRLQRKGIGTSWCDGTFITQTDVDMSIPDPPDDSEQKHLDLLHSHQKDSSACKQLFLHCRIHGHSLAHFALGTGGRSRATVKEIYTSISSGAERTFNFTANLVMAGLIAGIGIAANSSVSTVASMLISPMMGPILAIAFGSTIMNPKIPWSEWHRCPGKMLLMTGIQNTFIAIVQVWLIGFIQGFAYSFWAREFMWPTPEMTGRGDPTNLLGGIVVATASGVVVGVGITGGGINALVGVAISASLLPPIVNCGMCCAFAIIGPVLYDCLGSFHSVSPSERYVPTVVNGTTYLLASTVEPACGVEDCGAWSLDDLMACQPPDGEAVAATAPLDSCACIHGADAVDPHSPWILMNKAGTPQMFDQATYVQNGFISLALFFLNFGIIYFVTIIVFHYKRIKATKATNLLVDQVHYDPHVFHPDEIAGFVNHAAASIETLHGLRACVFFYSVLIRSRPAYLLPLVLTVVALRCVCHGAGATLLGAKRKPRLSKARLK